MFITLRTVVARLALAERGMFFSIIVLTLCVIVLVLGAKLVTCGEMSFHSVVSYVKNSYNCWFPL